MGADVAHRTRRAIDEAGPGVQVDDGVHRRRIVKDAAPEDVKAEAQIKAGPSGSGQ